MRVYSSAVCQIEGGGRALEVPGFFGGSGMEASEVMDLIEGVPSRMLGQSVIRHIRERCLLKPSGQFIDGADAYLGEEIKDLLRTMLR